LQCHQQPPGNACGFYVVHHMFKAMELLSMANDPEIYLPSDGSFFFRDLKLKYGWLFLKIA